MVNESSAVLKNVVIERDMPRGYTWAKFRNCWTGDLADGRFMPPELNMRTGHNMPAAFFCTIIVYDPVSGFIEREVKFIGADAENMVIQQHDGNILRINAEGHISTKSIESPQGTIARSIVMIKEGSVEVLEVCRQSPRNELPMTLEEAVNMKMREIEPKAASAVDPNAHIQDASFDEAIWPGLVDYDSKKDMGDAPF